MERQEPGLSRTVRQHIEKNSPAWHNSMRLRGYDYRSKGAYFVTICTRSRECIFGDVDQERVVLNDLGRSVQDMWTQIPTRAPGVRIDTFVVMPNHIHGIVWLGEPAAANPPQSPVVSRSSPGQVIRAFKARVTAVLAQCGGRSVFQGDFYDHIVRDEADLERIRAYILSNPSNWDSDRDNPKRGAINRAATEVHGTGGPGWAR